MPVLVRLQHCVIAMYFNDHAPPHFHVLGNDGREAQLSLDGARVYKGVVDRKALKEAQAWASENQSFLQRTWDDFSGR